MDLENKLAETRAEGESLLARRQKMLEEIDKISQEIIACGGKIQMLNELIEENNKKEGA